MMLRSSLVTLLIAGVTLAAQTRSTTSANDEASLIAETGAWANEDDPGAAIDWSKEIAGLETFDSRFHTAEGVRPGSPVTEVERILGATKEIVVSEAAAPRAPQWPDTYVARLEALALVQTLNAEILASRSATASLETWCRDHRLAPEPKISAQVMAGAAPAVTPEQRQRLEVDERDEVRYRHVLLKCGSRVLSDAENWYVPKRLTPAMNRLLDTTTTPFGRAVESLEPYRRTFAVTMLWTPLPAGWERDPHPTTAPSDATLAIPDALFEHRALLYTREHRPFSEVREVYQRELLAFPPRAP